MLLGNVMLLILNLPLVRLFAQLLRIRAPVNGVVTILVTLLGVDSLNTSMFDVWTAIVAGRSDCSSPATAARRAHLVLAAILGRC